MCVFIETVALFVMIKSNEKNVSSINMTVTYTSNIHRFGIVRNQYDYRFSSFPNAKAFILFSFIFTPIVSVLYICGILCISLSFMSEYVIFSNSFGFVLKLISIFVALTL